MCNQQHKQQAAALVPLKMALRLRMHTLPLLLLLALTARCCTAAAQW
jgi:hypothetical protein